MKRAAKIYTALIFVFLFAPIVILLVFSFNEAKSLSVFSGFSLKWYQELFRDGETLNALKTRSSSPWSHRSCRPRWARLPPWA